MITLLRKLLYFFAGIQAVLQCIFFLITFLFGSTLFWHLFLPALLANLTAIACLYAEHNTRRRIYLVLASVIILLMVSLEMIVALKLATLIPPIVR